MRSHFPCPTCGHDTRCVETRKTWFQGVKTLRRRRTCDDCKGLRLSTVEMVIREGKRHALAARKTRSYMHWTGERVKLLRQLWDDGLTRGQIATRLGVTRPAIIGIVSRLKLADTSAMSVK